MTIFIANTISSFQMKEILNETYYNATIKTNSQEQKDFLIHYYQIQSDWINKWLTLLGIICALGGVGIPILLNISYKEKIKEMQAEVDKNIKLANLQEESLKTTISQIKKDYHQKMDEFKREMKETINQVEIDSIINKLESFEEKINYFEKKGLDKDAANVREELLKLGEASIKKHKDSNSFCFKVMFILASNYYSKGLDYDNTDNNKAIKSYEKSLFYHNQIGMTDLPSVQICLLKAYIKSKQYNNAIQLVSTIPQIEKIQIDGTHYLYKENLFETLRKESDPEAIKLAGILEEIAVDSVS